MIRKLCVLFIFALSAVVLADHILAVGSSGRGSATSHDGRLGAFHYSVAKRSAKGHHNQFEGSLRFEQHGNHHGPWVLIEMGRPNAVAVGGNVCEFSGAGTLTRVVKGHNVTVHGHVSVRVSDRRNPHHNPHGDPDTFRIHFEDAHHNTFDFDGLVSSGDLTVFSRHEH